MAASATSSTAKPASSFAGSPSASDKQTPPQGVSFGGAMAAALLVGVALLGGFYTLNQTGVLPLKGNGPLVTEDMLADRARLETLERRFAELAAAEATVAANAAPGSPEGLRELETRLTAMVDSLRGDNQSKLADLAAQLDAVRQGVPQPGPVAGAAAPAATAPADAGAARGLAARVDGLQGSVEAMTSALASVQAASAASDAALKSLADGQVRDADAVAQLSELTQRGDAAVAELKTAAGEMAARLAAVEEMMGDASAREMAARALSVSALRAAVDAGRPFVTELAAVKAALGDTAAGDMAALEAEAAEGIAPTATLMAQFPPIARAIHATLVQPDPEAGVLDSLLSSAASLVAVRGPGDASGTGPEAALRQMENAVKAGDLAAALVAYDALPEAARGLARWLGQGRPGTPRGGPADQRDGQRGSLRDRPQGQLR
ncbi:COG4223 family protein [Pannonibacter sp. SL95]|uniref:COG4223 family protein n=1 Tax=Pannonibacter sp. SL95 TaxID=2995153 RepID=UPI0022737430|nr:mitofilin family membrane protein [Pannonibacter sp. SL95]MCY1706482.1 mitofilin family membrane protein [Pannonibacter sp. SL95]